VGVCVRVCVCTCVCVRACVRVCACVRARAYINPQESHLATQFTRKMTVEQVFENICHIINKLSSYSHILNMYAFSRYSPVFWYF